MKRSFLAVAAVVGLGVLASAMAARAAPPTVTPSPGYDARLQEQRTSRSAPTVYQPAVPQVKYRRHRRPAH